MADQLQLRGGTTNEHSTFTGALREVTVDTDKDTLIVHDAATAGGHPLAKEDLSNVPTGTITSTMIADGTIVNADINASAEIAVSKLADGAARQLLQTDAAGTGVEWTNNVDVPGTLDVTSVATFDNIASHSLGAAATPSITFTGDTNTGLYSPGADQVAISTGGTGRLFVDASGRVGAGGSPTAYQLESRVSGNNGISINNSGNTGTDYSVLDFTQNGAQKGVVYTNNNNFTINAPAGPFYIQTNGSNALVVDSSQRVGVGTSSPSTTLHVDGTATVDRIINATTSSDPWLKGVNGSGTETSFIKQSGEAYVTKLGVGTTSPISELHVEKATQAHITVKTASSNMAKFGSKGNDVYIAGTSGSANVIFKRNVTSIDHPADSGTETFRIDSSGRVGIGTSSPSDLLSLSGTGTILSVASGPVISLADTSNRTLKIAGPGATANAVIGTTTNHNLEFITGNTVKAAVDTSGRLGIGTTSPNGAFDTKITSVRGLYFSERNNQASITSYAPDSSAANREFAYHGNNHCFYIGGTGTTSTSEAARIDSSGRLLVGTSTASGSTNTRAIIAGNTNSAPGVFLIASTSTTPSSGDNLGVLRFSDAGHIHAGWISCDRDGGTWTSGSSHPTRLVFSTTADGASSPTERMRIDSNGAVHIFNNIRPWNDNTTQLGTASRRWSTVFAATGTINTSDANLKQDVENLEQAELNIAIAIKGLIKKYRFIDAVQIKGDDARIHVGVIAQEVEQAFIDEGLDPRRYALFCEDTLEDGSKRLGIRYDELLAFVIAAL